MASPSGLVATFRLAKRMPEGRGSRWSLCCNATWRETWLQHGALVIQLNIPGKALPMLKVLPVPVPVKTPEGPAFARYALAPKTTGEPWWVFYRAAGGEWFTMMLGGDERLA